MNDERNESRRQLLSDVLREDPGGWGDDKEAALSAFRRGRLLRRARRASLAVMIVAVATAAVLVIQRDISKEIPLTVAANVQPSERSGNQPDMPRLTDEELIASFPANSCFLAEVEGRQILVFVDPRVEEKVLGKGLPAFTRNP
jgi:hypothetical protein